MIMHINLDNLDGFGNYEYRHEPSQELDFKLYAIASKLNQIIEVLNKLTAEEVT